MLITKASNSFAAPGKLWSESKSNQLPKWSSIHYLCIVKVDIMILDAVLHVSLFWSIYLH